jgi:hypothetical protein
MKNKLTDIVNHSNPLGIERLRVEDLGDSTGFYGNFNSEVGVQAVTKTPIEGFTGLFGIPSVSRLKTILNFPDYAEKSKITTETDKPDGPISKLVFVNEAGDFSNVIRLIGSAMIEGNPDDKSLRRPRPEMLANVKFYDSFEPSMESITRLKRQTQASASEVFSFDIDNEDLRSNVGDSAGDSGSFIFHKGGANCFGNNIKTKWPAKFFITVLETKGRKTMRLSDKVCEITVDNDDVVYTYQIIGKVGG